MDGTHSAAPSTGLPRSSTCRTRVTRSEAALSTDGSLGFLLLAILAIGYLLPSIIVTLRGCRHAGLYWLLNITLGWSVMMWAYLLMRAILIDHENDDRYR
jgi:hypothetical protein